MSPRLVFWPAFLLALVVVNLVIPPGTTRDLAVVASLALGAVGAAVVEFIVLRQARVAGPTGGALRGRVVLASFFLGRDGRAWREGEITDVRRALEKTAAWLMAEAEAWSVPLEIELAAVDAVGLDETPRDPHPLDTGLQEHLVQFSDAADDTDLLRAATRAAAQSGHADLPTWIATINHSIDADRVVWFLHSLSRGQSHVLDPEHTGLPDVSLAVCYAREQTPAGPHPGPIFADPITYIHELLHVFGASDKYGGSTRRYPRGAVTSDDIMLLHHESLSRLRIDPLTAREIGWHTDDRPLPEAIQRRTRRAGKRRRDGS